MTGEEIKSLTLDIFGQIETLKPNQQEELEDLRYKIFELNLPIVQREMNILQTKISQESFSRNYDDYRQAMHTALWEAITKFRLEKGDSLYTFASFYIKQYVSEITREEMYNGTMSASGYDTIKLVTRIVLDLAKETGKVRVMDVMQQLKDGKRIKVETLASVADRCYSLFNHVPVNQIISTNKASAMDTEKMFFDNLYQEQQDKFLRKLPLEEQAVFYAIVEDDLGPNIVRKMLREEYGMKKKDIELLLDKTICDIQRFYKKVYKKHPYKRKPYVFKYEYEKEEKEEEQVFEALTKLNDVFDWEVEFEKSKKKDKKKSTKANKPFEPEESIKVDIKDDDDEMEEIVSSSNTSIIDLDEEGGEEMALPETEKFKDILEKSDAIGRSSIIDEVIDSSVKNYIRKKVYRRINALTKKEIEMIVKNIINDTLEIPDLLEA